MLEASFSPSTIIPRGPRKPTRLAYLVTHPIQYQVPLLRRIASLPGVRFKAFFQSRASTVDHFDSGFGQTIKWDVPLLDGYDYEFLPAIGGADKIDAWRPYSFGLASRLRRERFDVLWVHGFGRLYNLAIIAAALARGLRVLIRDEATAISRTRTGQMEALKGAMLRAFCRGKTRFLAIGTLNRRYLQALGIPPTRIFDMPYCVDNAYFQQRCAAAAPLRNRFRAQLGLDQGASVILFASKFQPRKRPHDLLDAYRSIAQRFPPSQVPYLLMVGDGELRLLLEQRAAEHRLERVRFLGFCNQSELPAFFDLCDVFVLPSVEEPWGLVINEVMNAGRAVVVSDQVGCAADLVHHGENGFVVPAGNPALLGQALYDILIDPTRVHAMGRESRRIIDTWSLDADLNGLVAALDGPFQ
jgi:glycosyltransferase involved in cell wall biosynthesis